MDNDPRERAAAVAANLLQGWERQGDVPLVGTDDAQYTDRQLVLVHGLAAHAHYLAPPALDLLAAGHVLAALPLVRTAYEAAITAQWITRTADGAEAFINEDVRQRRNHAKTLEQMLDQADVAAEIKNRLVDKLDTGATARTFDRVCDDLTPGGAEAYVVYRMLSQYSHASVLIIDAYLQPHPGPTGVALRRDPEEAHPGTWAAVLASALVWACAAIDDMTKDHPRRTDLEKAARHLGISPRLDLSPQAAEREQPEPGPQGDP